jgi:membrane protein YdbS with pleckstrin-like domain
VLAMGFPRRLLREGEDLILDLRPHPIAIAFNVVIGVVVIVALILILVNMPDSWPSWVRWATFVLAVGVIVVASVPGIIGWLTSHFVVTSERVIHRSGWISKHQKDIPLDRIQNVGFTQSVFERIIGAGDLEHVQKTIYVVREQDEQRRLRPAPAAPPPRSAPQAVATVPGAPPVADELAKLADLRDRGVISEAEFQAQKARLLGA